MQTSKTLVFASCPNRRSRKCVEQAVSKLHPKLGPSPRRYVPCDNIILSFVALFFVENAALFTSKECPVSAARMPRHRAETKQCVKSASFFRRYHHDNHSIMCGETEKVRQTATEICEENRNSRGHLTVPERKRRCVQRSEFTPFPWGGIRRDRYK